MNKAIFSVIILLHPICTYAQCWNLNGNTVSSEKFVGTIDTFDFPIRLNNIELFKFKQEGQFEIGVPTNRSIFIGKKSGIVFRSTSNWDGSMGDSNVVVGYGAAEYMTGGRANVFMGYEAGNKTSCGAGNIMIGFRAGYMSQRCRSGVSDANVYLGYEAGYSGKASVNNTFVGNLAGYNNEDSTTSSVFVGASSGYHNKWGKQNTYVGTSAGQSNDNGNCNTAVGHQALLTNVGSYNTVVGWGPMKNGNGSSHCTAMGYATMVNNCGDENCGYGADAGHSLTTGNQNTFVGNQAGYSFTTGNRNICLGYNAGIYATGSDHIYIGVGLYSNGVTNEETGKRKIWMYGYQGSDSSTTTARINGTLLVTSTGNSGFGVNTASERMTVGGRIRSTNSDIVVESSSRGFVLKDNQSPAHYWRITVSNSGSLVITDLGTSLPSE